MLAARLARLWSFGKVDQFSERETPLQRKAVAVMLSRTKAFTHYILVLVRNGV